MNTSQISRKNIATVLVSFATMAAVVLGAVLFAQETMLAQVPTSVISSQRPLYDVVIPLSPGGIGGAALSNDGKLLAYAGSGGLFVTNLGTGKNQPLLKSVDAVGNLNVIGSPAFSPKGDRILFSASGPTWYYPTDIYAIDIDGTNLTKLTTTTLPRIDGHGAELFTDPRYAPDGQHVALDVYDVAEGVHYAGVLPPGVTEPRRITEGHPLLWSTDGSKLSFTKDGSIGWITVATGEVHPALGSAPSVNVIGEDPELGAVFVMTKTSVMAMTLSNSAVLPGVLPKALTGTSIRDDSGRALIGVQNVTRRTLLLLYSDLITTERIEVIEY